MLRDGDGAPPVRGEAWLGPWPLVGRVDEVAVLDAALTGVDVAGLVLAGPAGVGKTRLAIEVERMAQARGRRTARVIATRSASEIPLGALAPLLPPLPGRLEIRVDLLAWAADRIAHGDRGSAVGAAGGSADGPDVLVVDDADLLDDASAIVVHQLAHTGRAFVVATLRSPARVPEPVHALWKDGLARRIEVRPLARLEVDELLAQVLADPVDGACRRDLWEASHGNPLFLRELVVGAIDAGVLARGDGVWRLARSLATTPRLVELVEARLVDLDEGERDTVELLAVGEPLGLHLLSTLVDPAALDRLEQRQLIDVAGHGRAAEVRLGHPLYGEVLRDRMTALRTMAVNRRLADAVEATTGETPTGETPTDVLRLAVWRLDGGGHVDPGLMLAAARRAYFAHDDELAARLARQAWTGGGGTRAGLLLAQVLGGLGRHDERCQLDETLAGGADSDEERALVAMDHSIGLFWGLRRGDDALDVLSRAEATLAPGGWLDEVRGQRAVFELLAGNATRALAQARPVLDGTSAPRARFTAAIAAAPALALLGKGDEAVDVADAAFAEGLTLVDEEVLADPGIHVVSRVLALAEMGRLDEAGQTASVFYDMAVALRNTTGLAWLALLLGRTELVTGALADAATHMREAAGNYRALGQDGPRRWCMAGQVLAAAMTGRSTAASELVETLDSVPPGPMLMMEPDVLRARAWEALGRGDEAAARTTLRRAAELAEDSGSRVLAMSAWHDLARIGFAAGAAGPIAQLASDVAGPLPAARAAHVRALATHDVSGLVDAADRFEATGAVLLAAEAVAAASATAHRGGQGRLAERLGRRAAALTARCQNARTPALGLAGATRALTPRERQVAGLAAAGLASKAIAARLGLAVRTVDNHLQHAYDKLGVSDRVGLREALTDGSE